MGQEQQRDEQQVTVCGGWILAGESQIYKHYTCYDYTEVLTVFLG